MFGMTYFDGSLNFEPNVIVCKKPLLTAKMERSVQHYYIGELRADALFECAE